MKKISVNSILAKRDQFPLLDTRSPSEYMAGHIPEAISLPLFEDDERSEIGTIYKKSGQKEAIKAGLSIVGPKMTGFIKSAEDVGSDKVLMHCWRGGMRSQSMAWLLELYGLEVLVMDGGYKAYRNELLDYFKFPLKLRVLTGTTGSMKTPILHELEKLGEQVIDLEGLAHHNGSSFGNQLSKGQPTTEQFQNNLFEAFLALDKRKTFWIEDESFMIGKVHLMEPLYKLMQEAPHFHIAVPKAQRIKVLVESYGGLPKESLIRATEGISQKLGKDNTETAIRHIISGELEEAVGIILQYYDRAYQNGIAKKEKNIQMKLALDHGDPADFAHALINKV